ncbi:hypothetical protein KJ762_01240 [bacterium]|nr:hypothetical protein [bacterium]MBU1064652.1 hypothetical protein [bacterium]MBU1633113.1 hypothetical protein [bacterium]MBU1874267.1 hypothetical protein [bacterium]
MEKWVDYLSANPVVALALVVVLVLFLFMVFRKLIKWALISFIILAIAIGVSYNEAQKSELMKKTETILKKSDKIFKNSEKDASKAIDKIKKDIKKKSK